MYRSFLLCLELIMGSVEVFRGVSEVYLGIKIGCRSDILGVIYLVCRCKYMSGAMNGVIR